MPAILYVEANGYEARLERDSMRIGISRDGEPIASGDLVCGSIVNCPGDLDEVDYLALEEAFEDAVADRVAEQEIFRFCD